MKDYTIGIDIGGTNFRMGFVDENGEIDNFIKKSSRIFDDGNVVEILCAEIQSYINEFGKGKNILAAALGIPSIVSKDKRTILSTPNLKGFDNVQVGDTLSKRLGFKVFLDRDVNYLLQNDISKLGLDTSKTILGFYVGTGFGNSIYLNGSFYYGKNGAAGELGHIPLYHVKDECTCSNIGCAEVRCSGKRLEYLVDKYFPDTIIRNIFKEHGDSPVIVEYVKDLALPIATEINILDPDHIVLAGGVLYMVGFPKNILVEEIHKMTRKPYPEKNLDILFSEHNQLSGVYGSGDFAFKAVANTKKSLINK